MGVFTTINIGPLSDVSFDGTASNDVMFAIEGPKEQSCFEQLLTEPAYPCFESVTEGWFTVDFKGTSFI